MFLNQVVRLEGHLFVAARPVMKVTYSDPDFFHLSARDSYSKCTVGESGDSNPERVLVCAGQVPPR